MKPTSHTTQPTSPKPPNTVDGGTRGREKRVLRAKAPEVCLCPSPTIALGDAERRKRGPSPRGPVRAEWSRAHTLLSSPAGCLHPSKQSPGRAGEDTVGWQG